MKLEVDAVLVAKYDIDKNKPVILDQCPANYLETHRFQPELTENSLAQTMLPDDLLKLEEDCYFFLLQQSWEKPIYQSSVSAIVSVIQSGNDLFKSASTIKFNDDSLSISMTSYQERSSNINIIWKQVKSLEKINEATYSMATQNQEYYCFELASAEDEQIFMKQIELLKESIFAKSPFQPVKYGLTVFGNPSNRKNPLDRRSITIISSYPYLNSYRPILSIALSKLYTDQCDGVPKRLYDILNAHDLSKIPQMNRIQKQITRITKRLPTEVSAKISSNDKIVYEGHNFMFKTQTQYDTAIIPVKIPIDYYPEEFGDISVLQLINKFHQPDSSSPSGFMIILHALLSQRRLLFMGVQRSGSEISKYVQTAVSLCAPVLSGFICRAFPYVGVENKDSLMKCPGYIAGCSNQSFISGTSVWDVCCDITTGKVIINPQQSGLSPYGGGGGYSATNGVGGDADFSADREKELISYDIAFMKDVMHLIQQKGYTEMQIRTEFMKYVENFVQISSSYERERLKMKYILNPSFKHQSNIDNVIQTCVGPVLLGDYDNANRQKLLNLFMLRSEQWINTSSHLLYKKHWILLYHSRLKKLHETLEDSPVIERFVSIRMDLETKKLVPVLMILAEAYDHRSIFRIFNYFQNLKVEEVVGLYQLLYILVEDAEMQEELLYHASHCDNGLMPLAAGLFHSDKQVRTVSLEFLDKLKGHQTGNKLISNMNLYFLMAIRRVEDEIVHDKQVQMEKEAAIQKQKDHIKTSQDSVESKASSYQSHIELESSNNGSETALEANNNFVMNNNDTNTIRNNSIKSMIPNGKPKNQLKNHECLNELVALANLIITASSNPMLSDHSSSPFTSSAPGSISRGTGNKPPFLIFPHLMYISAFVKNPKSPTSELMSRTKRIQSDTLGRKENRTSQLSGFFSLSRNSQSSKGGQMQK